MMATMIGPFRASAPRCIDPTETKEWIDSLDSVNGRPGSVSGALHAWRSSSNGRTNCNVGVPPTTIDALHQHHLLLKISPSSLATSTIERRIRAYHPVERGSHGDPSQQGRTTASAGTSGHLRVERLALRGRFQPLLSRGRTTACAGDHVYFQGHAAPGVYARAYLEGRLTEQHGSTTFVWRSAATACRVIRTPASCPSFWEYPHGFHGAGPDQLDLSRPVQQATCINATSRTRRQSNDLVLSWATENATNRRLSVRDLALAGRSDLDNLKWVINCNLQRLDGPVRGNDKVIQELEGCVPRCRAGT